jgi:uncharacterized protein (DUF1800 family)
VPQIVLVLSGDVKMSISTDLATLAFNRFGLGARFDLGTSDRKSILADPRGYLKSALTSEDPRVINSRLRDTKTNMLDVIGQAQERKAARVVDPKQAGQKKRRKRDAAMADTVDGMEPEAKAQPEQGNPKKQGMEANVQRDIQRAEVEARFTKAYEDGSGFVERLVWFWSNHFAVSGVKGPKVVATAGSYEREAIRPHVLGQFGDMLRAAEQHPTMLFYLDNQNSIGPNSKQGNRNGKGLNENLAREILELHTLGVNGGYSQADITSFAKAITGWTWVGPNNPKFEPVTFVFNPNTHEPGTQTVLGKGYDQKRKARPYWPIWHAAKRQQNTSPQNLRATSWPMTRQKHLSLTLRKHF